MENPNKGRKLKYLYQRMPEEKVTLEEIRLKIKEDTGYAQMHINKVIDSFVGLIAESIADKKSFYIPEVGTLYPTIKTGKNVVKINKFKDKDAELMYMPERWVCKFKVKPAFGKLLMETPPTKEEVNNLYRRIIWQNIQGKNLNFILALLDSNKKMTITEACRQMCEKFEMEYK